MRAVGFSEPGGPDVLDVYDVPRPEAGADEVRIRVHAASVNPSDLATRSGVMQDRYSDIDPPFIPGWDAAGVITAAGPETGFDDGEAVFAVVMPVLGSGGAYQDEVVVPAQSVVRCPEHLDATSAATIGMNGLTALVALEVADLDAGDTLAVTGSAGALGGYVVQIASHRGIRVIADASDADRELIAGFGAADIVARGDGVADRIRELVPDGVDAVVDAAVQGDEVIPAIRDNGDYVAVRGPEGGGGTEPTDRVHRHDVLVADHLRDSGALAELVGLVEEGVLTPRVAQVYPAEKAAQAHRRLEDGGVRGRLVLDFS